MSSIQANLQKQKGYDAGSLPPAKDGCGQN